MENIHTIHVNNLPSILEIEGDDVALIDVRERIEFDTFHIPGSLWMPIASTLMQDLETIPAHVKHWVFICQHGVRSLKAAHQALSTGFSGQISHVAGGIHAWHQVHG